MLLGEPFFFLGTNRGRGHGRSLTATYQIIYYVRNAPKKSILFRDYASFGRQTFFLNGSIFHLELETLPSGYSKASCYLQSHDDRYPPVIKPTRPINR